MSAGEERKERSREETGDEGKGLKYAAICTKRTVHEQVSIHYARLPDRNKARNNKDDPTTNWHAQTTSEPKSHNKQKSKR